MTSPADLPPPAPDRGNPVRGMIAWVLFVAAVVCVFIVAVLAGLDRGWVPVVLAVAAAVVLTVAGVAVLAGKGRRP